MPKPVFRGRVKFFLPEKGWGGIESDDAPGDVLVHFSVIAMDGYHTLTAGEPVEFRYEAAQQDSWVYRATWVRPISPKPQ